MAKQSSLLNAQIREEATAWFVDFNEEEVDAAGQMEFNAWLRRSPEHVRAFLEVSAFWEDAQTLGKRSDLDIAELVDRAKAEGNVRSLDIVAPGTTAARPARRWSPRISLAVAATLLLAIGSSFAAWQIFLRDPAYSTQVGEQRSLTLEDGSSVELNSRSRIKLRFTPSERAIELIEGQALFKVAKDPARPFVVSTGDTRVRAVGTQFDVYRKQAGTVVTVVEGRVAVAATAADEPIASPLQEDELHATRQRSLPNGLSVAPGEVLLAAGEQLVVKPEAIEAPRPANVAVATAWTQKRLVFDSTPLRDVVEEFNRYNRRQLVISDPQLDGFHISGVFPSTDPERMVEFLRQRFGVSSRRSGDEIEISGKDGA